MINLIKMLINKLIFQSLILPFKLVPKIPANVYFKNKDGVYLWCNDNQAKTVELKNSKKVIGKTDLELPWGHTALAELARNNDLRIMRTGFNETMEERAIINGQERVFLSQKTPVKNKKNEVIGILGVSVDITERKNTELQLANDKNNMEIDNKAKTEFLEQLLLEMPAHVYWKDKNGIYLGCNDNQAQTFNFTSGKDVIGKTDLDLLNGNTKIAGFCRQNDLRIMNTGIKETIEEKAMVSGQERIYLSQKSPLRNKQRDIIGILGISIDITERKQMEEQLIEAIKKSENANKAKAQFLQNMRHDFRTPFTGILGMASILSSDETDQIKKEQLNSIVTSTQILLEQLNEITDFVAMEEGSIAVLEKQFDLHKVINDLKNMLLPLIQEKSLEFIVNINKEVPKFIIGDLLRTQRILTNLLANAIKFTKEGHVLLQVSVGKETNNEVIINFTVKDTGIGISKEEQDIIFEKFSRLTPSYKGTYSGKGLGLRIVKQFADELNGEIHLESQPDKGTEFIVLVPYKLPLLSCDEKELLISQ